MTGPVLTLGPGVRRRMTAIELSGDANAPSGVPPERHVQTSSFALADVNGASIYIHQRHGPVFARLELARRKASCHDSQAEHDCRGGALASPRARECDGWACGLFNLEDWVFLRVKRHVRT